MKFKNHPRLETRLKTIARSCRDAFRGMQAARLTEQDISMPDFLGIGAPRAASTWLHSRLSLHPEIYIPHRKELHFFDRQDAKGEFKFDTTSARDRRLYATFFQRDTGLIQGEITPAYSILPPERVSQIVQFLPHIKVIYILRNPIERAWSGIRRRCWYGEEKTANNVPKETLLEMSGTESLLIRGDYRRNIDVWESEVPSNRIHYILYDDIVDNGSKELEKLCRFLGVTTDFLPMRENMDSVVNEAPGSMIPKEIKNQLREYYIPDKGYLEKKFGRDLSSWYR